MSGNRLPLAPEARSLGKYEVLCRLSTGGMAEIFLASQRGLAGFHKLVVLKQILPDIRGEEEFVRMFLDEAKVTAAFNHPHIAQVYDLDIADGELFLSMEFVPGATLVEVARACRQAQTPIPMGYSLMAVRDTAVALHYAHTFTDPLGRPSPVIHRDVAEKNIMVTYEGVTKLLDFGIAKSLARASRTAVGMVKGTSGYMSPEQIMGEQLDARSDLFSLGVVLHECLTGMRLFYAKQADAMMNAVLRCEVTPPSRTNKHVPPELDAIVMRALSKRREDRYASTLEFARAIERAVGPLIWHPEQSSELMLRLFSDRRDQTRQLLASGQDETGDTTGVVKLARVMAMGGLEASELPTGAVTVTPPKHPVPPKALTPPPPPSPRRTSTTTLPASEPMFRSPVLKAPPGKKLTGRPPPPPLEALPPPPPESGVQNARTVPGLPAIPPEHTVRAQLPSSLRDAVPPPPPSGEPAPRQGSRGVTTDGGAGAAKQAQGRVGKTAEPPPPPDEARSSRGGRAQDAAASDDAARSSRGGRAQDAAASDDAARSSRSGRAQDAAASDDAARSARGGRAQDTAASDDAARSARGGRTQDSATTDDAARSARGARAQDPAELEDTARSSRAGRAANADDMADEETTRPGSLRSMAPIPSDDAPRARASRTPNPSPAVDEAPRAEPRSRSTRTQDGLRAAGLPPETSAPRAQEEAPRARSSRTQDGLRAAVASPQPAERDLQTAMIRMPVMPADRGDDTAPLTPTARRGPQSRRRQSPSSAEPATQPVRVHDTPDMEDEESTLLNRGASAPRARQREAQPPPPRRSRAWMAVAGVVGVLALGAALVMLGRDGGIVSSRLKPQPTPMAATKGQTGGSAKTKAVAPSDSAKTDTAAASNTPEAPPAQDADPSTTAPTGPNEVELGTLTDVALAPTDGTPESSDDEDTPTREPRTFKRVRGGSAAQREKVAAAPQRKARTGKDAASVTAAQSESAPMGEPGFLTLVTEPKAQVFFGGKDLGKTPLLKVKLPAGQHTLKLVDATDTAHQVPVDIKPGETTSVRGPLSLLSDP
ncbi:Serine/threonine kinase PKN13 [Myxococcus hansupus]|uniref:Serine/threonine kinase PKN13 n=1 Tax=Pseudomyxococcus hansupus TaxID=1297742 RepID=A0A0H4X822_9BACT|nr:protein kinase [Myxococcus hansupus]AKQ70083.1 Serine/threonine kinase PKN13 [Myxococcus hansupus]